MVINLEAPLVSMESQESSQGELTIDRYLGGRLATSPQTGQYMGKLRFVHKASVECRFANDSTTLRFCERRGKELHLLNAIEFQGNLYSPSRAECVIDCSLPRELPLLPHA